MRRSVCLKPDHAQATTQLKALAASNNVWKEEDEWYLALTYLQQGEQQKCLELLQGGPPPRTPTHATHNL